MCFAETMSKESPGNIPDFTTPFVVSAKKAKKRARSSGGILVYTKPSLRQHVKMLKGSDSTLWLRIDSENVGLHLKKSLFCYFCYIKPYSRRDLSETAFNQLENEITEYIREGEVLLCGDFNAWTGGLTDYLSLDEIGQTFSDCPIPNYYTPDLNLPRNYLDKQSNINGENLLRYANLLIYGC